MVSYLVNSLAEGIKLAEDVHLRELERFVIGIIGDSLLRSLEAVLVLVVETTTGLQFLDQWLTRLVPHTYHASVGYVALTSANHLIGDLGKEKSYTRF